MAKYTTKFLRNEGAYGMTYYGPFDYNTDDDTDVTVACDVIEVLERWHEDYDYYTDTEDMTWIKCRPSYEPASIIEEDVLRIEETSC